jgi:hypothetical protein
MQVHTQVTIEENLIGPGEHSSESPCLHLVMNRRFLLHSAANMEEHACRTCCLDIMSMFPRRECWSYPDIMRRALFLPKTLSVQLLLIKRFGM